MFPIIGEVVIRTNSFETALTVDAPSDTVKHYSYASSVDVRHIASASYHENGTVGRLKVADGHVVLEPSSMVICPMDIGDDVTAGKDIATIEVKEGATICEEGEYEHAENGTAAEFVPDCGAGNHDFGQKIIIDNKYVYEICKCCGYTLVHVVDEITGEDILTTKKDSTGTVVNTPSETYSNNPEVFNEDGTVKADATPSIPATDVSELDNTCEHEFEDFERIEPTCYLEGSKTVKCSKCGATVTTAIAKVPHRFYDVPSESKGKGKEYEEKCIYHAVCHKTRGQVDVCKIGDTTFRTLSQAIDSIEDATATTITMIADEAVYGNDRNAGYTISAGRNITIDLNGHSICNFVNENKASQVFTNKGTLTICDSSDINADGTGYGKIYNTYDYANENVQTGEWWGTPQYNYATNVITNNGILTVESGHIFGTATSSICYAIDNNSSGSDTVLNVKGGLIDGKAPTTVRMFCNSTTKKNEMNVSGGKISGSYTALWIQLPGSSAQKKLGTLNVTGGTLEGGSYAFYDYSYGDLYDEVRYNLSGGTFNGAYAFFSYGANIEITGGEYNGEVAIKQSKPSNVSVSGGTCAANCYMYGDNATKKFIEGGTFLTSTYVNQGTTYYCDWLYRIVEDHKAQSKIVDGVTKYRVVSDSVATGTDGWTDFDVE